MFRLTFADGGELVLTEAGKKKRAGVWLLTPAALEAELAHLGPDALGARRRSSSARSSRRERRQLHPSCATSGARGHRTRTRERDPLAREAVAVQALDRPRRGRDRAARDRDRRRPLPRARPPRGRQGRRGRLPDPRALRRAVPARPRHARRVAFEEHTITYCPTCQTGGKELKDRRLSRLSALVRYPGMCHLLVLCLGRVRATSDRCTYQRPLPGRMSAGSRRIGKRSRILASTAGSRYSG